MIKKRIVVFMLILVTITALAISYLLITNLYKSKQVFVNQPIINEQNESNESTEPSPPSKDDPTEPVISSTPEPSDPNHSIAQQADQILESLTISQKIGQLLIVGIDDQELTSKHKKLIKEQHIGSIILFKNNISDKDQLTDFIAQLKKQNEYDNIPLWISIDQEGGIVNRLPEKFPSAAALTELHDTSLTLDSAISMGKTLAQYDIDLDFAPVLDINSNPKNPVIGSRAFGTTAEEVSKQSIAMLQGLQPYVVTVGKHFPGHGDTNEDSHLTLPVVNKSWEELKELELKPFYKAIEQHIDALMVGHLYLPKVDSEYPASLSKEIVQNRLREEMGFTGLIISDDLEMGGITEQYKIGDAAVLAIQAGVDMLIVGHQYPLQKEVIASLNKAVESGKITEQQLDEHVRHILQTKLQHEADKQKLSVSSEK